MTEYEKQVHEFESMFTSVIDSEVKALSKTFDKLFDEQRKEEILPTIKQSLSLLRGEYNIPTQMQINYDIANGYHDLRLLTQEEYLEKEIYYLRYALDLFESNYSLDDDLVDEELEGKAARYIAMRSYTNIGNTMRTAGRYIAAIDYFHQALLIQSKFAMASLNLSFTLFEYAQLQIRPYEQNYFHHACYYYYKQTKQNRINLENQEYLSRLEDKMFILKYLTQLLQLKNIIL